MNDHKTKGTLVAFAIAAAALMIAYPAQAATEDSGTVSSGVDQLVEIEVTDAAIALGSATPSSGTATSQYSTADSLVFSNANSNVQAAWDYGISASFTKDADGSTVTDGSVSFQGTSVELQDLIHLGQESTGKFLPWLVSTGTDLSGETSGWTSHADCADSQYKGSFSVAHFDNTGSKQAAETLYYEVCDSSTELYLDSDKDLSAGDKAIIISQASSGSEATAANYEVAIQGVDYVFYSAADASSVTLRQGRHVDHESDSNSESNFALLEVPNGFPAGSFSVTLTASASDINSG